MCASLDCTKETEKASKHERDKEKKEEISVNEYDSCSWRSHSESGANSDCPGFPESTSDVQGVQNEVGAQTDSRGVRGRTLSRIEVLDGSCLRT